MVREMTKPAHNDTHFCIPHIFLQDRKLNFIEKGVLTYLYQAHGKGTVPTNREIADFLNIGYGYVRTIKKKLHKLEYLIKKEVPIQIINVQLVPNIRGNRK